MTRSRNGTAFLIIDMINDLQFEGAEDLLPKFEAVADVTLKLRGLADRLGVLTVYVNDNYGQWFSDRTKIVNSCLTETNPGRHIVRRIAPRDHDAFVIKPQMSGFYSTNLQVMLPRLGISRLIMAGIQTDICILFTAADAHMRDYELWVPADAVASERDERGAWALATMRKSMEACVEPTTTLTFQEWLGRGAQAASS